ncbi:hypothetical protein WJX73_009134 [Symbiochloris irregularis]|uniref:HMG box domain-containing protein n=1 Tax=Symbiochloris irregularis TaxID=706552 RepID=A0AAW1NX29_9CHLO
MAAGATTADEQSMANQDEDMDTCLKETEGTAAVAQSMDGRQEETPPQADEGNIDQETNEEATAPSSNINLEDGNDNNDEAAHNKNSDAGETKVPEAQPLAKKRKALTMKPAKPADGQPKKSEAGAAQTKATPKKAVKQVGKGSKEHASADKKASKSPGPKLSAKNAYAFFMQDKRSSVKDANPDMSFADITKEVAAQWKALSEEDKAPYVAKAEADKVRVQKLKADQPPTPSKPVEAKDKQPQAKSAYIFFCAAKRPSMKSSNPDAGFGDIAKLLAVAWKELSDEEKKPYQDQHEAQALRPKTQGKPRQKRRLAPSNDAESDDEQEREECDWDKHPAQIILGQTMHSKFIVKRSNANLQDYGLVDCKAAKRQRLEEAGSGSICPVPLKLVEDYESFVKSFSVAVMQHKEGNALNLDVLPAGSPLEVCYYLGKLMENNFPLSKVSDKVDDRMIKLPMLQLSMTVQRLLESERKLAKQATDRVKELESQTKALETKVEDLEALLQAASSEE